MLRLNGAGLSAENKIIAADEYQAHLDANQILREAEHAAELIRQRAEVDYEEQRKQGYEDGLTEGRMEMAEKMVESVARSVDYFESIEREVVQLVVKSVKKILGDLDQHERIVAVVKNALAVARTQSKVIIRVCPAEVELVRQRLKEIMQPYPAINFIDIVPDHRLDQGGCVLETEIGIVDAGIDVQLKAIEKALSKSISGES